MLNINLETVCFIIIKAREFSVKVDPVVPAPGSNPSDDRNIEILEDYAGDPTHQELVGTFDALDVDQALDVAALAFVGRGDFDSDQWEAARDQARDIPRADIGAYLLGMPLLADYLENGLSELGYSCEDIEVDRL